MAECKDCLYSKNCQFLLNHKTADANGCTSFEDKSEWVKLPCKAGDTIFLPWEWNGENGIARLTVLRMVLTEDESYIETDFDSDDYDYFMMYNFGRFWFKDFGKMVFTTHDEAQSVLDNCRKESKECT